jgi:hypothetical protein
MLIGVRKRFVFVANSKTASTSIEQALVAHAEIQRGGTPQRKHIPLREALGEYDFLFGRPGFGIETFFTFAVLRDPIDWIGSWFRYRRGNTVASPLPPEMTFAEFWARRDWNFRLPDGQPRLQSQFVTDAQGRVMADYLIPHADLQTHFQRIAKGLGLPAALERLNVSHLSAETLDIPDDLRAELRAFYAADYALIDRMQAINAEGLAKLAARGA